jgi:catechol 2,3-dioxygenase-like lactoylglutathione lyase family enzyme
MKIKLTSVYVDDQEKALRFYTEKLGFQKKAEYPAGDFKWLTVVSAEEPDGTELYLAPNNNPAAKALQQALKEKGTFAANFSVDDVQREYDRLVGLGVTFTKPPTKAPWGSMAILDDTCGNLIQLTRLTWGG